MFFRLEKQHNQEDFIDDRHAECEAPHEWVGTNEGAGGEDQQAQNEDEEDGRGDADPNILNLGRTQKHTHRDQTVSAEFRACAADLNFLPVRCGWPLTQLSG